MLRGRSARHVASRVGLVVVSVETPGVVHRAGLVLHIGPGASERAVIEAACRYWLGLRGPVEDGELARYAQAIEADTFARQTHRADTGT